MSLPGVLGIIDPRWKLEKKRCEALDKYHKFLREGGLVQDQIKKPQHYNKSSIEAIEYIKDSLGPEGFTYHCEGTVKKYLHRFRYKGKPIEDLKKARQYLDWLITTMEELDAVQNTE